MSDGLKVIIGVIVCVFCGGLTCAVLNEIDHDISGDEKLCAFVFWPIMWIAGVFLAIFGLSAFIGIKITSFISNFVKDRHVKDTVSYMTDEEMIGFLGEVLDDDYDIPEKVRNNVYEVYEGLCVRSRGLDK